MRKFLWLAPALLLAGCHSAQISLQPPATFSEPIATAPASVPLDSALTATVVAPRAATLGQPVPAPTTAASAEAGPRSLGRRVLAPLAATVKAAAATKVALVAPAGQRLAQRWQRQRPTEGVAESGLGRVALFFIGVVLAVLAGLAALVNVIFGVGFFTALGYTAAGLVVLFLLYSLLSGGKKKR